ncbi:hypothetical protein DSM112329_00263 [Paraconexibacter sp. AEG42_29]|uniref:Uncharacterized protein n=1 Tax=Paraconexibacter sp. AEG42_29 TaxID=2997339 RepID=A0AAU7AP49_9ACTN
MRSRLIVFLPLLLLFAAAPSVAAAASIAVDRGCYADAGTRKDTVRLSGSGFTPNAQYQVTLDGQPLPGGTGSTDAAGNVSGSFASPRLRPRDRQQTFLLGLQEGANTAKTTFTVSRLLADFAPASGDPRSLRVRFSFFGFGLSDAAKPPTPVYVHYVRPDNGRVQQTVRLGTAKGRCGTIARTAKRKLFPFAPRRGAWKLQFDSSKTYRRGTSKSPFLFFTVVVNVRPT